MLLRPQVNGDVQRGKSTIEAFQSLIVKLVNDDKTVRDRCFSVLGTQLLPWAHDLARKVSGMAGGGGGGPTVAAGGQATPAGDAARTPHGSSRRTPASAGAAASGSKKRRRSPTPPPLGAAASPPPSALLPPRPPPTIAGVAAAAAASRTPPHTPVHHAATPPPPAQPSASEAAPDASDAAEEAQRQLEVEGSMEEADWENLEADEEEAESWLSGFKRLFADGEEPGAAGAAPGAQPQAVLFRVTPLVRGKGVKKQDYLTALVCVLCPAYACKWLIKAGFTLTASMRVLAAAVCCRDQQKSHITPLNIIHLRAQDDTMRQGGCLVFARSHKMINDVSQTIQRFTCNQEAEGDTVSAHFLILDEARILASFPFCVSS